MRKDPEREVVALAAELTVPLPPTARTDGAAKPTETAVAQTRDIKDVFIPSLIFLFSSPVDYITFLT